MFRHSPPLPRTVIAAGASPELIIKEDQPGLAGIVGVLIAQKRIEIRFRHALPLLPGQHTSPDAVSPFHKKSSFPQKAPHCPMERSSVNNAGKSTMTKMEGKIKRIMGKMILMGAFIAAVRTVCR